MPARPSLDPRIQGAIQDMDIGALRALLDKGLPSTGHSAPEAMTAMALASAKDWPEGIRALADAGHPLDDIDPDTGMTPFLIAVQQGCLQSIETLLALGADRDASDIFGRGALYLAACMNSPEVLEGLARHGPWQFNSRAPNGTHPIEGAIMRDRPDTIAKLVEMGADPLFASDSGRTFLLTAAELGRLDCARRLLGLGCDPNAMGDYGISPLMADFALNDELLAKALLESGADPRISNANGVSAATLAKTQPIASSALILQWVKMLDEQEELGAHVKRPRGGGSKPAL